MDFFDVLFNNASPGCLVAAQMARVLCPFMNCSYVNIESTLSSCFIVTLPALVSHPIMNYSFVLIKTQDCPL